MKSFVRFWLLLAYLGICCTSAYAQNNNTVYSGLKKRYGDVRPWGHGYILHVNETYAFADSQGRLVWPFRYRQMKPLLNDRMVMADYQYYLTDADGRIIYTSNSELSVADSLKRRLKLFIGSSEIILDDSGRQLTWGFDTSLHGQTMMPLSVYHGGRWKYGLINRNGDTILSPVYDGISAGTRIYAAIHQDTLLVWEQGKGLLFKSRSFHGCKVLRNDLITVSKWGAWALMGRNGKLLTNFKYYQIEDFLYPYSIYPRDAQNNSPTPEAVPGYALVDHQPKGLINAKGQEVLPLEYDDIWLNTNGWMILHKSLHEKAELVDPDKKEVLESSSYGLSFLDERYVSVESEDGERYRYYNMQQRCYVKSIPEKKAAEKAAAAAGRSDEPAKTPASTKDSIYINSAFTLLHREDGLWGITSVKGDTVLPFLYDTAVLISYGASYVGRDGKYYALSAEGSLLTPALPDVPLATTSDSVVVLRNGERYSYKGRALSKQDPKKEVVDDGNFGALRGGIYVRSATGTAIPPGIYNRQLRRIADYYNHGNTPLPTESGLVAISDSSGKNIAVIDSAGKIRMPFTPRPAVFELRDHAALLIYDTSKADLLYTFSQKADSAFKVHIERNLKYLALFGSEMSASNGAHWREAQSISGRAIPFNGERSGFVSARRGNAIWLKGLKTVSEVDNSYTLVGAEGGWTVLDKDDQPLWPDSYDTIAYVNGGFILGKNRKLGAFDIVTQRLYPAIYDDIGYLNSIGSHFLLVQKGDSSIFIDDQLRPIPPAWNVPFLSYRSAQLYTSIAGIQTEHNGRKYKLYATAGDSLMALPDEDLPEGATIVQSFMDGSAIMQIKGKTGVYNLNKKSWLIPPKFQSVNESFSVFSALTGTETYMYKPDGTLMFKVKGNYPEPKPVYQKTQWYMGGWFPAAPVVNSRGKIIVPDTFAHVVLMEQKAPNYYEVWTKDRKYGVFDTNGRMVLPAVFDGFSDMWYYGGYFEGWRDNKGCLISPQMKQITPVAYRHIFPATIRRSARSRGFDEDIFFTDSADMQPFFIVSRAEKDSFGVVGRDGKELLPCIYDSVRQVHHAKIAVVKKGTKWALVTLQNKPLTSFSYDSIDVFYLGRTRFQRGDVAGTLQEDGTEVPDKR